MHLIYVDKSAYDPSQVIKGWRRSIHRYWPIKAIGIVGVLSGVIPVQSSELTGILYGITVQMSRHLTIEPMLSSVLIHVILQY